MNRFKKSFFKIIIFFFMLSFFSFMLLKLAPGDPVMKILGVDDLSATKQDVVQLKEQLGLNKPLVMQYIDWLKKVVVLDFGKSLITGKAVVTEIGEAFPYTLILACTSMMVMFFIAVPLGVGAALNRNGIIDKVSEVFNLIGASIPGFWLGFILVDIFSIKLNLLPSMGTGGIKSLILPSLTLGISMSPPYVRLIKSTLIQSMEQDFIRAAKARGVCKIRILFFHAFRNSLIPVLTLLGMSMGSLMGGTVIIEVLFGYPGLGKLSIDAISKRDYGLIQGFVLFTGMLIFLINIVVDILCGIINPSIGIKEVEQVEN